MPSSVSEGGPIIIIIIVLLLLLFLLLWIVNAITHIWIGAHIHPNDKWEYEFNQWTEQNIYKEWT